MHTLASQGSLISLKVENTHIYVRDQNLGCGEVVEHTMWLARAHSPALRYKILIYMFVIRIWAVGRLLNIQCG